MRLKLNAVLLGAEFYNSCFRFPRKAPPKKFYMPTFVYDTSADRRQKKSRSQYVMLQQSYQVLNLSRSSTLECLPNETWFTILSSCK